MPVLHVSDAFIIFGICFGSEWRRQEADMFVSMLFWSWHNFVRVRESSLPLSAKKSLVHYVHLHAFEAFRMHVGETDGTVLILVRDLESEPPVPTRK